MKARVDSLLRGEQPIYLLGLVRVCVGVLVLLGSIGAMREVLERGYFRDAFYIPLVPESLVPSQSGYLALFALRAVAAVFVIVGVRARLALFVAGNIGLFALCCDRLQYHNNRYLLELVTFLLAFTPCDRSFRLVGTNEWDARGPSWAVWLIKLQISLVYLASAGSKLVDVDWRGGQVLHIRYLRVIELAAARGHELPGFVHDALSSPLFAELTSKAAISGELFLAIGLWLTSTRALSLWLGVLLHLGIQLAAHVEIFSFLMGAAYVLFARPELRERKLYFDPKSLAEKRIVHFVRRLDWLARWDIVERSAEALSVTDRGGETRRGFPAWVLLARTLPLLFPVWLPLAAVSRLRGDDRRLAMTGAPTPQK